MDLFDLFAKISLDTSEYEAGLEKASKKLSGFASGLEKGFSGTKSVLSTAAEGFKAIEGVGQKTGDVLMKGVQGFAAASTAVAGFGGTAVKAGMNFDSAMSQVSAVSGATGADFDALRDKAIEMGAKTQFSASEAAAAMNYMAMAGWKTEDMLGGISGIMNLAAASGEDLATTSDIVTDALTAFGMTADKSGHFADILATASSNANTNVGMMGETFKYVAPLAGTMGYSAEDTALAIGLMANSGIKASQAGTSLRSIMTRLAKPTKESGMAMDALGISITNSDGSMKPLGTTIEELRTAFSGLSEEEKTTYAAMLGGQEAMSGLIAALLKIFEAAVEIILALAKGLIQAIPELLKAVPQIIMALIEAIIAFVVNFVEAGAKLIMALGEGIAGAWESIVEFFSSSFQDLIAFLDRTWEFIKNGAKAAWDAISEVFKAAWDAVVKIWEAAGEFFSGIWDTITGFFSNSWDVFSNIGENIVKGLWNGIDRYGGEAVKAMKSLGEDMADAFNPRFDFPDFSNNFGGGPGGIGYPGSGGPIAGGPTPATVIINSPTAVDPIQAAREWNKTAQRLAVAYI